MENKEGNTKRKTMWQKGLYRSCNENVASQKNKEITEKEKKKIIE